MLSPRSCIIEHFGGTRAGSSNFGLRLDWRFGFGVSSVIIWTAIDVAMAVVAAAIAAKPSKMPNA